MLTPGTVSGAGVSTHSEDLLVALPMRLRGCALVLILGASALPANAATHVVPAGGDLQAALTAAQPGDVILLESGATYTGNFRLPLKAEGGYITVRTDAPPSQLPGPGVRITPAYAPVLAKIRSGNSSPALATMAGTHHWRFEHLEFQATTGGNGDIIALGAGSSQTLLSQQPHHLVFDRVYIHGDPVVGQKRGIALNSGDTEIVNSYIADIKARGVDAQAICGWNGTGPYRIENNYLEASGENVMFGGSDATIPNLVPSDIVVRGNLMSKPLSWQGEPWSVKNIFELKNARRVLVEGNIFEHIWKQGQVGFAILFTPRNQGGRAPWSVVEDVAFRYNIVRHAGGGVSLTGWDDEAPSAQTQRIHIAHNLFYDVDARWGGPGAFLQIGNNPRSIVVEHNTVVQSGTAVSVYGRKNGAVWPVDGFVFRHNLVRHNAYGVIGDGQGIGNPTLAAYFPGATFERNVLAGGQASAYPVTNYFPTVAEFDAAFANPSAGDFSLVITTPFRALASDGGALGADIIRVRNVIAGGVSSPGNVTADDGTGSAPCRSGGTCDSAEPYFSR
jgi:hypothetical protein